jgi:hypothetical protein
MALARVLGGRGARVLGFGEGLLDLRLLLGERGAELLVLDVARLLPLAARPGTGARCSGVIFSRSFSSTMPSMFLISPAISSLFGRSLNSSAMRRIRSPASALTAAILPTSSTMLSNMAWRTDWWKSCSSTMKSACDAVMSLR